MGERMLAQRLNQCLLIRTEMRLRIFENTALQAGRQQQFEVETR